MVNMRTPQETQMQRLRTLKRFFFRFRRFPTYDEMLVLFKFASKNAVFKIVNKWVEGEMLIKDRNRLVPTDAFFSISLLGVIRAGLSIRDDALSADSFSLNTY